MSRAFYNEHDPKVVAWLEELIAAGDLPPGHVDDRDVQLLGPDDHLEQYDQCHFFGGIGGWSHALDLAGWPRDRAVWSASLPCQPFSDAGKSLGVDDDRHLWPVFLRLVEHYRPECIVGEQVASKAGRAWFAAVQADLEALGYWCGAIDICAAGIGAPHIRQRFWWCAFRVDDAASPRRKGPTRRGEPEQSESGQCVLGLGCKDGGLVHPDGTGRESGGSASPTTRHGGSAEPTGNPGRNPWGNVIYIPCADGKARPLPRKAESGTEPMADGVSDGMVCSGDPSAPQAQGDEEAEIQAVGWTTPNTSEGGLTSRSGDPCPGQQVAFPPLVTQATEDMNDTDEARTMRLKGYGNSVVAPLAAEFIGAVMEIMGEP